VFEQGDPPLNFYIVVKGKANVVVKNKQKAPLIVSSLGKGDYFGEMALLNDTDEGAGSPTSPLTAIFSPWSWRYHPSGWPTRLSPPLTEELPRPIQHHAPGCAGVSCRCTKLHRLCSLRREPRAARASKTANSWEIRMQARDTTGQGNSNPCADVFYYLRIVVTSDEAHMVKTKQQRLTIVAACKQCSLFTDLDDLQVWVHCSFFTSSLAGEPNSGCHVPGNSVQRRSGGGARGHGV
jgi:hypothetical protein